MHELSIAEAIAEKVEEQARGRRVQVAAVRIGRLRRVAPAALELGWSVVTESTPLDGCRLEIEDAAATFECAECAAVTTLDAPIPMCATCGSARGELLTGNELVVVALAIADP